MNDFATIAKSVLGAVPSFDTLRTNGVKGFRPNGE
jgi:hypothetical protein